RFLSPRRRACDDPDHVTNDIANLPGSERASEWRHVAAAFGHRLNRCGEIVDSNKGSTRAMSAPAVLAMAHNTGLFVKLLTAPDPGTIDCWCRSGRAGWRPRCGCLPRNRTAGLNGRQFAVQTEQPHTVSAR